MLVDRAAACSWISLGTALSCAPSSPRAGGRGDTAFILTAGTVRRPHLRSRVSPRHFNFHPSLVFLALPYSPRENGSFATPGLRFLPTF